MHLSYDLTPVERIKGLVIPQEINEDLAYFCGVLAGDGSIGYNAKKKHWWIKCIGNPRDEMEFYDYQIKTLIKKLFNLDVKMKLHDRGTCYGFTISSRSLVRYFTEFIGLPLGKKYDTLKIPNILIKGGLVKPFICGVADTDFHLAIKRKNYPVIVGVSKSRAFINEIGNFLKGLEFNFCVYKRSYYDKRFGKSTVNYAIQISGHKFFGKWMKEIGLKHPKNKEKINFLGNINSGG